MVAENQAFDGEIVVLVDDEYWMDDSLSAVVTSRESGKSKIFSAKALASTLSARLDVNDLKRDGADTLQVKQAVRIANYLERALRVGTDPELMGLIMEGRLQVAYLLNSPGGDNQLGETFLDMMDDVVKRRGENQAYITSTACSAAFDNMAYADKTYLLEESILGWHLTTDADIGDVVEEARYKDVDELLHFIHRAKEPYRTQFLARIDEALRDPHADAAKMYFYGVELALAGCVDFGFEELSDMRNYFGAQFWAAELPQVQQFWEDSIDDET